MILLTILGGYLLVRDIMYDTTLRLYCSRSQGGELWHSDWNNSFFPSATVFHIFFFSNVFHFTGNVVCNFRKASARGIHSVVIIDLELEPCKLESLNHCDEFTNEIS